MKVFLLTAFVLSAITMSFLSATDTTEKVIQITSTTEGQEVEFTMAALSSNEVLALKSVKTPYVLEVNETISAGILLEVTQQQGGIKAEVLSDSKSNGGVLGKSMVITHYLGDVKLILIAD